MIALWLSSVMFSCFGVLAELVFTAIYNAFETRFKSWKGEVSLLMFPVYFCAYFALSKPIVYLFSLFGIGLVTQSFLLISLVYVIEYAAGIAYRKFGQVPWHYEHTFKVFGWHLRFDVDHVITFLYLPLWFIFALVALKFHAFIMFVVPLILG